MSSVALLLSVPVMLGAQAAPRLTRAWADSTYLAGDPVRLVVSGVPAGDSVTVSSYRRLLRSAQRDGRAVVDTVLFASRATFRATRATRERMLLDSIAPMSGDWRIANGLAPLYAMSAIPDSLAGARDAMPRGVVDVVLTYRGRAVDSVRLRVTPPARLAERVVVNGTIAGAYAAPADGARHPFVLALHGSEGGDTTSAKALARRFAARGFATLAVAYVAYPYTGVLPGVPSTFTDIPVETLDRARAWGGSQPEADTTRTAIWGASKGAEFALVAAARRPWVRTVVACVPSDVVWSGFGREVAPGERLSSWSDGGRSLPAIQYDRYEDVFSGKASAREVHDRSRAAAPSAFVDSTRIDLSSTRARMLLIGSESDEVWSSGSMTRELARRHPTAAIDTIVFPRAAHTVCGDGTSPAGGYAPRPYGPAMLNDPAATAEANAIAWLRTIDFLRAGLR